jgi:hypothetical protein
VERWIAAGNPLQIAVGSEPKGQATSALEIALEARNHALVLLLLCNGYDSNLERRCPLDQALRSRQWALLDLLLEWGADPQRVSVSDLLDSYNSKLFERFRELGVDLTADHEIAYALGYHTSNKPLFGYVKHHRDDPKSRRNWISRSLITRPRKTRKVSSCASGPVPTRTLLSRASSIQP